MKKIIFIIFVAFVSCKKDKESSPSVNNDNYSSMADFISQNEVPIQNYSFASASGLTFTTSKGTTVAIPPNAFKDANGIIYSGQVNLGFKDICTKSEMFLANIQTSDVGNHLLKSAGMFYIKVSGNGTPLQLETTKNISISMVKPANESMDTNMLPFVRTDSMPGIASWNSYNSDSIIFNSAAYTYQLNQFIPYNDTIVWHNIDNPLFYLNDSIAQAEFFPSQDPDTFNMMVSMIFSETRSMASAYRGIDSFNRLLPKGRACTMVALGIKNGKVFSSFIPFTTATQVINFTLSETTTEAFKSQLDQLN